jgi:pilus assembly protein CpaC
VNASEIVLPTDGYKAPTDLERVFLGKLSSGVSGEKRPMPQMVSPSAPPAIGAVAPVPAGPQDKAPANREPAAAPAFVAPKKGKGGSALPGFSLR